MKVDGRRSRLAVADRRRPAADRRGHRARASSWSSSAPRRSRPACSLCCSTSALSPQLALFALYALLAVMVGRRFYANRAADSADPLFNDRVGAVGRKSRDGGRRGRRAWRPRPGRRRRMERARRPGGSRRARPHHRRRRQLPECRGRAHPSSRVRRSSMRVRLAALPAARRSPPSPPAPLCPAPRLRRPSPRGRPRDRRRSRARCSIRSPRICFACRPKARPRSASTTAPRAALRSQLGDRSAAGQQRLAATACAPTCRAPRRSTPSGSVLPDPDQRRGRPQRLPTALEGFALPYGDVAVGGWRNTPYVVIQNVGAYLDTPRFLDTDHPIENAGRRRSLSRPPRQPIRRSSTASSGGSAPRAPRAWSRPLSCIDKAIDQLEQSRSRAPARAAAWSNRSSGAPARRISPAIGRPRARTIAQQQVAPALERQIAELQAAARRRDQRRRHVGAARTATNITAGRSRPRPPRP